ncbi:hypothetical protein VNI00_005182 [Paramarasmius palmivorus]|uniref:UBX domain-containing protein n=1 Tax=Paramarasmius palmivorus TaxID=297713 RepID=A0AAW0DIT8_9AGAR
MSDDQPPVESSSTPTPPVEIPTQTAPMKDESPGIATFKVFRPPTTAVAPPRQLNRFLKELNISYTPSAQLPDDFYNPTASDLKLAQEQLAARTQALTNAPLQLRATREATEKAKRDRWPETRIRVKFPDRTQLEKTFPSTDKIKSVYAFVRNSLREDVKPIKFILYQPPRRDLKVSDVKVKNLSLVELQLAPSSVLLLRFEEESLNGTTVPAPLAPEVLAIAEDLPQPPSEAPPQTDKAESKVKALASALSSGSGEKKIPKWLKLGRNVGSISFDHALKPPITSFTIIPFPTLRKASAAICESLPSLHMKKVSLLGSVARNSEGFATTSFRGTS